MPPMHVANKNQGSIRKNEGDWFLKNNTECPKKLLQTKKLLGSPKSKNRTTGVTKRIFF
jgi:hypothetical protein